MEKEKQLSLLTRDQLPPKKFNPRMDEQEQRLLHLIPKGAEHPVKASRLCEVLRIPPRSLYDLINHLITVHGIGIGATRGKNAGYFIIQNRTELTKASAPLKAQAVRMFERIHALDIIVKDKE